MTLLFIIATLIVFIGLYFLPSIIAERNRHPNFLTIFLINLLLGWTFIGWLFAFVWALCPGNNEHRSLSDRLKELDTLKAAGKLTPEEYQRLREKILSSF